ncbi:MAG: hypothetical protein HYZ53_01135 [Planctomycetes bacterium]|nr:hypothetical protein [Planctomycetota bacterium]
MPTQEQPAANLMQQSLAPHPWTRAELALAAALAAGALASRTWHLAEQGLRLPDEGLYSFFGEAVHFRLPKAVFFKPLQALILYLPFRALVVTDWAELVPGVFLLPAALLGWASVLALGALARRAWGPAAGLVALAAGTAMPYLLFYHRSALSDANYLALCIAALWLLLRALPGVLPGPAGARPRLFAAASGALFAAAFWTNPAAAVLVVATGTAGAALVLAGKIERRLSAELLGLWAVVGLSTGALLHGAFCLASWYDPAMNRHLLGFVGVVAARSRWTVEPFLDFGKYAGPAVAALAATGAAVGVRRRAPLDLALLVLFAVVALYGARSTSWGPRIFASLLVPGILLAAAGGTALVERTVAAAHGRVGTLGAAACLCAALLASHAPGAHELLGLRSGYARAVESLLAERGQGRLGIVLAPQCANLLLPFSIEVKSATRPLAELLATPGGAEAVESALRKRREEGYSHLVLDVTFRLELADAGLLEFRRFLERNPPWQEFDNPFGRHRPTLAEDELTLAPGDPIADRILVFRLADLPGEGPH